MLDLSLVRIDGRLVHGQVCAMWSKSVQAKEIIVVDDIKCKDEFTKKIFQMAAPVGLKVKTISTTQAAEEWKNNNLVTSGSTIVLFENAKSAYDAYKAGFNYESLQIGGAGGGQGKKKVFAAVFMTDDEGKMLNELEKEGVNVFFQESPNSAITEWGPISKKVFGDI